jgi:uncharacterized protein (DUF302 family)
MIKKIILALSIAAILIFLGSSTITGATKLEHGAIGAYWDMFKGVTTHGDPAKAMMKEFQVEDDVTNEDVAESIHALAEEFNMRITGDIKMFTLENAKPNEVKHARIFSLCSLDIAKKFLNHSRYFGGFMPCRIMLVEYGNGKRYLITMDLKLAIYGGFPLPPKMKTLAQEVEKAMTDIPARAAQGDF